MDKTLDKKIEEYIREIPSLPTSVIKVLEICNNPNASPSDLNHIISLDPVLVGRVLKLINSAYYALGQPVTSIVRAIIMLGLNTVKNLVLSTAVMGNLSEQNKSKGLNMEGFWQHSFCVGVSAKFLAAKRGINSKLREEYFTAGLLHDIGKIPMNAVYEKEYLLTLSTSDRDKISLHLAEENTFGFDHCDAGAAIIKAWKLEGTVADVISYHHRFNDYSGESEDILYNVIAANYFASVSEIGFSGNRYPQKIDDFIWDKLGIDKDFFFEIETSVKEEIEKAKVFLKI